MKIKSDYDGLLLGFVRDTIEEMIDNIIESLNENGITDDSINKDYKNEFIYITFEKLKSLSYVDFEKFLNKAPIDINLKFSFKNLHDNLHDQMDPTVNYRSNKIKKDMDDKVHNNAIKEFTKVVITDKQDKLTLRKDKVTTLEELINNTDENISWIFNEKSSKALTEAQNERDAHIFSDSPDGSFPIMQPIPEWARGINKSEEEQLNAILQSSLNHAREHEEVDEELQKVIELSKAEADQENKGELLQAIDASKDDTELLQAIELSKQLAQAIEDLSVARLGGDEGPYNPLSDEDEEFNLAIKLSKTVNIPAEPKLHIPVITKVQSTNPELEILLQIRDSIPVDEFVAYLMCLDIDNYQDYL